MNLFQLDDNYKITLSPEIQLYKEFKDIVSKDRGSKGDNDGRKKYKAIRWLTYVYHMCDYRSHCREIPEDQVQAEALRASDLDEDFNPNEPMIVAAIERYKWLQNTRTMRQLNGIRKAIDASVTFCENFIPQDVEDAKKILSYPTELAKANKGIKELEEQLKLELTDTKSIRANAEKGVDEDPE